MYSPSGYCGAIIEIFHSGWVNVRASGIVARSKIHRERMNSGRSRKA